MNVDFHPIPTWLYHITLAANRGGLVLAGWWRSNCPWSLRGQKGFMIHNSNLNPNQLILNVLHFRLLTIGLIENLIPILIFKKNHFKHFHFVMRCSSLNFTTQGHSWQTDVRTDFVELSGSFQPEMDVHVCEKRRHEKMAFYNNSITLTKGVPYFQTKLLFPLRSADVM